MGANAWALIFVVVAGLIFQFVGPSVAEKLGVKRLPEKSLSYEVQDLKDIANDKATAAKYVAPLLLPFDVIVMMLLGGSMALASVLWARGLGFSTICLWIAVLLPVAYVAVDLAEDTVLAIMLTRPDTIDGYSGLLRTLTVIKFIAIGGAALQTGVLFIWSIGKFGLGPFWNG